MKDPRMIAKVICSACLIIAAVSAAVAQALGPRVDLRLIVTDETNKPLSTIRKEDVRVFEGKIEQTILSIEPDERPIDFSLVIDSSGSLRSLMPSVLEAARQIILQRRPSEEMFIESFVSSDKIYTIQEFTNDTLALTDALRLIQVQQGQSAVLDGVYLGATKLATHSKIAGERRKVLILVTDGEDRNSYYELNAILKELRAEEIQVFVIGLTTKLETDVGLRIPDRINPREKAEKLLTTLAKDSGGFVLFPENRIATMDAAELIGAALRAQFRITYQSPKALVKTEFRKVEVKLNSTSGEKRKVVAPSGYYVEAKDIKKQATEPKSP